MRDRQICIECAKKSPETETNYTLISSQFGWRLTRQRQPDGNFVVEWRCPSCWNDFKKRTSRGSSPQLPTGPSSVRPPAMTGAKPPPLPRPAGPPASSTRKSARPPAMDEDDAMDRVARAKR